VWRIALVTSTGCDGGHKLLINPARRCVLEKDYQQLMLVPAGSRPRHPGADHRGTVREPDGLALSSRTLSVAEDRIALVCRVLRSVAAVAREPAAVARELARGANELRNAGFAVEYLEIRDAETLMPVATEVTAPSRVRRRSCGPSRLMTTSVF
jgi:pantoate--beta-alanine ligase